MKNASALLILLCAPAYPSTFQGLDLYTSTAVLRVSGVIGVAASTGTYNTFRFYIDGPGGFIKFPDGTKQYTAGGGGGGGTSSTITVNATQFTGDGGTYTPLTLVNPLPVNITGNAASIANGVYTNVDNIISGHNTGYSWEANTSHGYAYNWVMSSTNSLKALYYTPGDDIGSYFRFDKYGLVISSGLRAGASRADGSGGVGIIGTDGRIPALTSTYFANMDGSAITGLSISDATKLPLAGGSMSGSILFDSPSLSTANLVFQGGAPHYIQFNNQSTTASVEKLAEIDFNQSGTSKQRIISYADSHATYPKEMQIGANTIGAGTNIRITGNTGMNPDLFVSSWTSVGVNRIPNTAYKLDVNGSLNASAFYQNGVLFSGGSGGDNLGDHLATMTITANYGVSASTISASNDLTLDNGGGFSPNIKFKSTSADWTLNNATGDLQFYKTGGTGSFHLIDLGGTLGTIAQANRFQGDGSLLINVPMSNTFISSVTVSSNVYIAGFSSATKYYGDGSTLSGVIQSTATGTYPITITGNALTATVATTATNNVLKTGDFMTGQLTTTSSMTAQNITLNNDPNPSLRFQGNNVNNGGAIYFKRYNDSPPTWDWKLWHDPSYNGKLRLYRRGNEVYLYAMSWEQNGNVGIGTIEVPLHKLHVAGDIYSASSVTAGGYLSAPEVRFNGVSISSEASAALGAGVRVSSNVYIVGYSSATRYYGDGSFLTGIQASGTSVSTVTIDALPIGTFIQYGSTTAPDSYLYCNGTSYSTTTYSALYAVIGYKYGGSGANFTCDFRGMFARGLDTTGTIDSEARVIGSSETFMSQGHWHYVDVGGRGNNLYWGAGGGVNQYGVGNAVTNDTTKPALATTTLGDAVNGTPIMGKETRPKNIAVAVMVKYQNPVVNYNGLTSSNTWSGSNSFTATGAGGTAISSATITSNYTTGFTQLGSTAPKIKVKKVTGTTNANQNAGASIAHGLTASKIISGVCVVWISADQYMASGYTFFAGYNFSYDVDSADIHLYNSNANSGNILSKPITCTFIYEE